MVANPRPLKLGIFLPNWIGDVVMCTPALRAMREHVGPEAQITAVLRPYVGDVLAGTDWIDDYIPYHPQKGDAQLGTWSVVRQLRARKLDAMVLLTNSFRTGALAFVSGARRRIGFMRFGRRFLLTDRLYHPKSEGKYTPTPAIDSYLRLAEQLGATNLSPQLELATTPADEAAADAVWRKFGLPHGREVVVLNSGGAYGSAKLWPSTHFAKLARHIAEKQGSPVLVNCGPAERAIATEIVRLAAHPHVVSLADEATPIGLTKACIRRARLLVTTDSGPRFFAVAFGVPTVTLFGPTHQGWSATHWAGETCLQREMECSPCMERQCPLGHHDCMQKLTVAEVYQAVARQLSTTARVAA